LQPEPSSELEHRGYRDIQVASGRHDEAKLISKTLPEKHTKHCVLEKSFLDSLRFAK
jgi:hypothetical protein